MTGGGVSHRPRSRFPVINKLSDFANIFKAFIGCNYLSLPFAFKQSGLILGIIGLVVIAYITDHCCVLIIKCKQAAVDQIINKTFYPFYDDDTEEYRLAEEQKKKKKKDLELAMTYGDLGQISMGKWGLYIVNTALVITQFSFCVNYFIFMGDTITRMFPKQNVSDASSSHLLKATGEKRKGAPDVILLMLIPFPFFMLQTYVRKIRSLGPLSGIANFCVFVGFFSILAFILDGLDFGNIYKVNLWQFSTFPIFFGQLVGAYEGIGTIVPIEASMNENRPNFRLYLHGVIILVSIILGTFGIFGYLHFTDDVEQLISDNLTYGALSIAIQIMLCIGILFTYPLQMFPVIEIAENYLFKETKERHTLIASFSEERSSLFPDMPTVQYQASVETDGESNPEEQSYVGDEKTEDEASGSEQLMPVTQLGPVLVEKPGRCNCDMGWSTWKRNILRTILVSLSFGVAYLGRDYYAYISAISGSIGSSLLAFILPCAFHVIIKKDLNPGLIIAKNILLILFGIIAGVVGFVTTLVKIIGP